jgi:hypothetical protein
MLYEETRSSIHKTISLIVLWVCVVLGVGCRQDVQTIWSAEARSPDGLWLATAHTVQHFGPGTAGIVTSVYLKRTNDSNSPTEILGFFHRWHRDLRAESFRLNGVPACLSSFQAIVAVIQGLDF